MQELLNGFPPGREWDIEAVQSPEDALKRIQAKPYGLVVTSPTSPSELDLALLSRMRRVRPHLKLILLTEKNTPDAVVSSIRAHAFSFFSGPFDSSAVSDMIERGLREPAWDDGIELLSAKPDWISLRLRCRMITAERLLHFMRELRSDLPEKEREDIGMAFREMLLNAIEHGGGFDPEERVDVSRIRTSQTIVYLIRDPGEGFSTTSLPQAAISNSPDEPFAHAAYRDKHGIRPGGFGILLSKGLVDELLYNEKGNEVVLIKRLT